MYASRRGVRAPLVDADGPLATPRLPDQLAVSLADRMPDRAVRVLGVRGLRATGAALALPARVAGWGLCRLGRRSGRGR